MPKTADIKRQLKRGMSPQEIFGKQTDEKFGGFFFTAMQDMVEKIAEEAINDLMKNERMLLALAQIAAKMAEKRIVIPKDGEKGDKGDKGEKGEKGEDGMTPVKGIDFFTQADKRELTEEIKAIFTQPQDGKTPQKGQDFFTPEERAEMLTNLVALLPETTGEEIVQKINDLPIDPSKQIDAKHIKNLPRELGGAKEGIALHRGGLKLIWDTQLDGAVNGSNTVFTVPSGLPDPRDNKFIVSARGGLKTSDDGDFTTSNNNRTITFTSAPPNGSTSPRIILYHGK